MQIDALMRHEVRGFFGVGAFARYDGAATTDMRMSGAMRTAIMSSPPARRAHAGVIALGDDVGQRVVGDLDFQIGYFGSSLATLGQARSVR